MATIREKSENGADQAQKRLFSSLCHGFSIILHPDRLLCSVIHILPCRSGWFSSALRDFQLPGSFRHHDALNQVAEERQKTFMAKKNFREEINKVNKKTNDI